ncbi:hypothetical protein DW904_19400 [Ruminococcus sp. AM42-11]|uniref:hypothetical protein n=1 Tax=Ruminococcus sp. AM42-11 TaxID=2292372 RepID=UPI000E521596|nr:hypothetical protein [Ruminococcus sp. AM42-11]RHS94901.1 hypothetical protein DW904_19400 [Ruminococcus sp. AM42-11]
MAEENKRMEGGQEYLTEAEAVTMKNLFRKFLKSYKEKAPEMNDQEWLEQLFKTELPDMTVEEAKQEAKDITESIQTFDSNLESCSQAAASGTSKENWLAEKLQEASVGMSVNDFGKSLQQIDDALFAKNMELADALSRSTDGHIMMSPNLDGNIAENMIAKTTELSATLQGKNISVEVLESHAANSVDVRAINHDTGQFQNYQLKFGKDAKARSNFWNVEIITTSGLSCHRNSWKRYGPISRKKVPQRPSRTISMPGEQKENPSQKRR